MKFFAIHSLLVFSFLTAGGQNQDTLYKKKLLSFVNISSGLAWFNGDVGANKKFFQKTTRLGYRLTLERLLNPFILLNGNINIFRMSEDNHPDNLSDQFLTDIFTGDICVQGNYLFSDFPIYPFLSTGIGFFTFNSNADLYDGSGNPYQFWSDGTLRTQKQSDNNLTASVTRRDYIYETQLSKGISWYIPITGGINFNISSSLNAAYFLTWHFTGSDMIDNVKFSGNDNFFFSGISVKYIIDQGPKSKDILEKLKLSEQEKKDFADVDWQNVSKDDFDKDGINDLLDKCPQTPAGIAVDKTGCPLDGDGDAVPDYIDIEPKTPKGSIVNLKGEQLVDSVILYQYLVYNDSLKDYLLYYRKKRKDVTVTEFISEDVYKIQIGVFKEEETPPKQFFDFIKTRTDVRSDFLYDPAEGTVKIFYTLGNFKKHSAAETERRNLIKAGVFKQLSIIKFQPYKEGVFFKTRN